MSGLRDVSSEENQNKMTLEGCSPALPTGRGFFEVFAKPGLVSAVTADLNPQWCHQAGTLQVTLGGLGPSQSPQQPQQSLSCCCHFTPTLILLCWQTSHSLENPVHTKIQQSCYTRDLRGFGDTALLERVGKINSLFAGGTKHFQE